MRDGEGEYDPDRQVVSMDGFVPAQTRDIDKMIRPQLEALAKGHMKTSEIKKLKVDQLRVAVKKLLEKNPNLIQIPNSGTSLMQVPTVAAPELVVRSDADTDGDVVAHMEVDCTDADADSDGIDAPTSMEGDTAAIISSTCMVLECDSESSLVFCDDCSLYFCSELHGPHRSHSLQMLRPGTIVKRPAEHAADEFANEDDLASEVPIAPEAMHLTVVECDIESTSIIAEGDVQSAPSAIQVPSPQKRRKRVHVSATSVTIAYQDFTEEPDFTSSMEVPMQSLDDNHASSRQRWESDKLKDAVEFIRSQLSEGKKLNAKSVLFNKFNYSSCYDIIFLKTLANEFDIDLSSSLSKKRPQIKEVLACLIDNLML